MTENTINQYHEKHHERPDLNERHDMKNAPTQMRAAYSPVNQAWFVIFGRKGAPIEQWSVISVGGWKVWPGKKRGRSMLAEELARVGLRFAPGDSSLIISENAEDAMGDKDE